MFADMTSHRQLHHLVASQLRTAILEGRYKPGEWLRQERLAQELGTSQMPVREALKELATEGLIEHVPYRGMRVVTFSLQDIEDLYEQRSFLEGRAAAFAADNITAEELAELRSLYDGMTGLTPDQIAQYRKLNRRFHELIFQASRRDYLIRTLSQMWVSFPTMLIGNFMETAQQPLPKRDPHDADEHRLILEALEKRQGDLAGTLMKRHILSAAHDLLISLQKP